MFLRRYYRLVAQLYDVKKKYGFDAPECEPLLRALKDLQGSLTAEEFAETHKTRSIEHLRDLGQEPEDYVFLSEEEE